MTTLIKAHITLKGTSDLLMHSERLVNSFDPIVKQIKEYTGKRKKTEEDQLMISRLEWEAGLYWSEQTGPYIPGANLKKCIQEAAKIDKSGKDILRGVTPLDAEIPLVYKGPRDIEAMWASNDFVDVRSVSAGAPGRKVLRTRPRFKGWGLETAMYINSAIINVDDFQRWVEVAGVMCGLGDYRPTFGRFIGAVKFE